MSNSVWPHRWQPTWESLKPLKTLCQRPAHLSQKPNCCLRCFGKVSSEWPSEFSDLPVLLLFYVSDFSRKVCGISAPWPGIRPTAPVLEGIVLTTGPPGKSLHCFLLHLHLIFTERFSLTSFLKFLTLISDYIVIQSKMVKHLLLKLAIFPRILND